MPFQRVVAGAQGIVTQACAYAVSTKVEANNMKIVSLQLSNILSFKFVNDIETAEKISFDDDLNIIIGENGSGKSTALEVINFLFKRVIYKQYNTNQDLYTRRSAVTADDRRQILQPANNNSFSGFRLDSNWNTESSPQVSGGPKKPVNHDH
jgi:predicted ATPase